MTRIIAVASGKGGVGKTTVVSNLAAALSGFNRSVIAIDGNLTTSNLGLHLGVPLYPVTLQDVLKGKAKIKDAVYYHESGFRVIPADVSFENIMVPESEKMVGVFYTLVGDADFILIDTAAGLGKESLSALKAADEVLVVTNPDRPSVTDALKLCKLAESYGTHILGAVINRVKKKRHELSVQEIENFLSIPVLGVVHEDGLVSEAIANSQPVVMYQPKSFVAQQFKAIAANLAGIEYKIRKPVFHKLFLWLK